MDKVLNPYAPGAGSPPPALEGRDDIREAVRVAVERLRIGRSDKSVLMVGLPQLRGRMGRAKSCAERLFDFPDLAPLPAKAALDESFFRVRFDRLTPVEKRYLRAMAELGPWPHRSGAIAGVLDRKVESLAPTRNQLIAKGMIWSPSHGDTAFTVPLFDEFMRRIMPGDDWR